MEEHNSHSSQQHGHIHKSHSHGHGHGHDHGHGHGHGHEKKWDTLESARDYDNMPGANDLRDFVVSHVLQAISSSTTVNEPWSVYDFGCGTSSTLIALSESPLVSALVGEDISEGMIEFSKEKICACPNANKICVRVINHEANRAIDQSIQSLPQQQYNVVMMCFVLHHILDVAERKRVLTELASKVLPGGLLVIGEFESHTSVHGYDGFTPVDFTSIFAQLKKAAPTEDQAAQLHFEQVELLGKFEMKMKDSPVKFFLISMKRPIDEFESLF